MSKIFKNDFLPVTIVNRRTFLKKTVSATLATTLSYSLSSSTAQAEEEFEKRNFWRNKNQNRSNRAKNSAISPPLENFAHQKVNYAKFSMVGLPRCR